MEVWCRSWRTWKKMVWWKRRRECPVKHAPQGVHAHIEGFLIKLFDSCEADLTRTRFLSLTWRTILCHTEADHWKNLDWLLDTTNAFGTVSMPASDYPWPLRHTETAFEWSFATISSRPQDWQGLAAKNSRAMESVAAQTAGTPCRACPLETVISATKLLRCHIFADIQKVHVCNPRVLSGNRSTNRQSIQDLLFHSSHHQVPPFTTSDSINWQSSWYCVTACSHSMQYFGPKGKPLCPRWEQK